MTKELKRFEQWWDAEDDIPNDGPYTPDTPIQFAWAGWQAALAQPERLAELGWQEIDCPICGGGARAFPKPEQEPVACFVETEQGMMLWPIEDINEAGNYCEANEFPILLYTTPSQRKPLTDEQIDAEFDAFASNFDHESNEWLDMGVDAYFRAGFKAAHGIKEQA